MQNWLKYFLLFVTMVLLQVLVFSQIQLKGMVNAFPYVYFILLLPLGTSGRQVLFYSALLGLSVDFLGSTMGVHMSACVFAAYARELLLPLLSTSDNEPGATPSVSTFGWPWFLRYASIIVLIHHISLFLIESFTFINVWNSLAGALMSALFSLLFITIFQVSQRNVNV